MPVRREGKLERFMALAIAGNQRGLILAGNVVAQSAQGKAPRRTGRLKRNISAGQPFSVGQYAWRIHVGTNVEYGAAQEFGSGLYSTIGPRRKIRITARRAKALAFEWAGKLNAMQAAGNVKAVKLKRRTKAQGKFAFLSFFAHVDSPGVHPHPYLRPALDEKRAVVPTIIWRSIAGALRGMGNG